MEDKRFIIEQIRKHRDAFVHLVNQQLQESNTKTIQEKWSAGQNPDHLIRSLTPVNQILLLPSMVFRMMFGKPNRDPRDYRNYRNAIIKSYRLVALLQAVSSIPFYLGTKKKRRLPASNSKPFE